MKIICKKKKKKKNFEPKKNCTTAMNLALSVVLMDTPIGNHSIRLILTALDTPPPSASQMEKHSNHVSKLITNLNAEDMSLKRETVMKHNEITGSSNPREITCSVNGRYNARSFHLSQKPGQAASQSYTATIENMNMTTDKYIIGLAIENKLCWTGAWLKNRGFKILCPNGHAGCTSNVPYLAPHSERKMAYSIAEDLSLEDFWVRTVTTDRDTKSWLGMEDFYQTLKATGMWNVKPIHINRLCDNSTGPNLHVGIDCITDLSWNMLGKSLESIPLLMKGILIKRLM